MKYNTNDQSNWMKGNVHE